MDANDLSDVNQDPELPSKEPVLEAVDQSPQPSPELPLIGFEKQLADRKANPQRYEPIRRRQYLVHENPRLSITNLMLITALCAATITAITGIGFIATPFFFAGCFVTNLVIVSKYDEKPVQFRFWNQFTWGILMPLVCIFGDPFVFGSFELGKVVAVNELGFGCYAFVGWQMLMLIGSWYVKQEQTLANVFLAGALMAGGFFSIVVGIMILPFTLAGLMAILISLAGFTPWFTGFVLINTSRMHLRRNGSELETRELAVFLLGTITAVAIGVGAFVAATVLDLGFSNGGNPLGFF